MNNITTTTTAALAAVVKRNVLAWQEAKRETDRRVRAGREHSRFQREFGRVKFTLPKGFALAA